MNSVDLRLTHGRAMAAKHRIFRAQEHLERLVAAASGASGPRQLRRLRTVQTALSNARSLLESVDLCAAAGLMPRAKEEG